MITKQGFFEVNDIVIKEVQLPAPYEGTVYIKSMNGEEGEDFRESLTKRDSSGKTELDLKSSRAKLLIRTVCDQNGNLLFTEHDVALLDKKSEKILEFLAKEANMLNGRGTEGN